MKSLPPRGKVAIGVLTFAAIATPAYWLIWFFGNRGWIATSSGPVYVGYENAFPLPDAWMTAASALGVWALLKRRSQALLWVIAAGSASVFLALADTLFDLENGIYLAPTGDWGGVVTEVTINVLTFACGAWAMAWAYRHRRELLAWDASLITTP
jgi:hypothetical protein